jgi:DNA-binding NarL/FixJ family response regulator
MIRRRVLLADDYSPILDTVRTLLEPEFEVVGTVTNGRALLTAAQDLQPDVIVLDWSMPLLNGPSAAKLLRKLVPQAKLIFLTAHADAAYAEAAFAAGASGYLVKPAIAGLPDAVRAVLNGKAVGKELIRDGPTRATETAGSEPDSGETADLYRGAA